MIFPLYNWHTILSWDLEKYKPKKAENEFDTGCYYCSDAGLYTENTHMIETKHQKIYVCGSHYDVYETGTDTSSLQVQDAEEGTVCDICYIDFEINIAATHFINEAQSYMCDSHMSSFYDGFRATDVIVMGRVDKYGDLV